MGAYDVIIIGVGVVGSTVARELSRFCLDTVVLEKGPDMACGNSSRNTGMLHTGFTYTPGSLKAKCAVEGNREFDQVVEELDAPFRRTGKLIVGFDEEDRRNILKFKEIGERNGVRGMKMIDKAHLSQLDPNAGGESAMYVPFSGILDPMQYTIALAENARANGVRFLFGRRMEGIRREEDGYLIHTCKRDVRTKWMINCVGMYASQISAMPGYPDYPVRGFKGEYYVLDKRAGKNMRIPVYLAPNEKGGFITHATPTIDGNILVGPDSYVTEGYKDYKVTKEHMDGPYGDGRRMFKEMKPKYFIRNFAGIRWKIYDPKTGENKDFVLESDDSHPCTVSLAGIESPGITCTLLLARRAAVIPRGKENPRIDPSFSPYREGVRHFSDMDQREKKKAIAGNPDYGEVICHCEIVTRVEILQAIHNPLGVYTVTRIKDRTRATMGRRQGGYCETRITAMIQEELGIDERQVRYSKENSYMFTGRVK